MTADRHSSCILCGGDRLEPLPRYAATHLVRCGACSLVFVERIPTSEELIAHYEGYGRNDYLSPITVRRYNELLDGFELYRRTGRLLDVGCGIGYFLDVAKERGWDVYGTEYTDEAVAICRGKGLTIHQGPLREENYTAGDFDVVTYFEVIEHINNPREDIARVSSLLRPGGLFYGTTPNFDSASRILFKEKWEIISYPEHLTYYTARTLTRLLREHGFRIRRIESTGFSLTRYRQRTGRLDEDFSRAESDDERLRRHLEKPHGRMIKKAVNSALTLLRKGDSLKVWATKDSARRGDPRVRGPGLAKLRPNQGSIPTSGRYPSGYSP